MKICDKIELGFFVMNKLYRSKIIEEIIIRERNINGIQDIDVLLEKLLSEVRKYVNADATATDYFSEVKLNRQKTRDEALDKLNTSLKNAKTGTDEAKSITASIEKLTLQIKQENDIESLITAKISGECVVVINDSSAQIVVKKGALNEDTALQIMDIVTTNTKLAASNIKITESV